jgi:hypothetical protein
LKSATVSKINPRQFAPSLTVSFKSRDELESKKPNWIRLPAMMRMAMTSPNVMKTDRPEWLAPFNFFLFPLLSDLGGYPPGFDRSTFRFITPPETNRKRWKNLEGINLLDGKVYRISMYPDGKRTTVVPESFQIILRQYLGHPLPNAKQRSLAVTAVGIMLQS